MRQRIRSIIVRITQAIVAITLLLLTGCNNSNNGTEVPYLMGHKPNTVSPSKPITKIEEHIALTAMEAKHQETLASIAAQKETRLQQLALEKRKSEDQTRERINASENQRRITIEKERQQAAIMLEKERSTLYQQYLIATVIVFILLTLLGYFIYQRHQALKLKLHEDELRHKELMLASQQHHERINKTLEILASEKTDKQLKKELVRLLKDQNSTQPKLLNQR